MPGPPGKVWVSPSQGHSCFFLAVAPDPHHPGDGRLPGEETGRRQRALHSAAHAGLPGGEWASGAGIQTPWGPAPESQGGLVRTAELSLGRPVLGNFIGRGGGGGECGEGKLVVTPTPARQCASWTSLLSHCHGAPLPSPRGQASPGHPGATGEISWVRFRGSSCFPQPTPGSCLSGQPQGRWAQLPVSAGGQLRGGETELSSAWWGGHLTLFGKGGGLWERAVQDTQLF